MFNWIFWWKRLNKATKSIINEIIDYFRRYHLTRRTGLLVQKSVSHRTNDLDPDQNNIQNTGSQNQNYFSSMSSSEGKDSCNFGIPSDCRNWRNRNRSRDKQLPGASLEMAAAPVPLDSKNSCHVYTNPNYPHSSLDVCGTSKQIEIGGLPFFLTSGSMAETCLRSPVHSSAISKEPVQGQFKTKKKFTIVIPWCIYI